MLIVQQAINAVSFTLFQRRLQFLIGLTSCEITVMGKSGLAIQDYLQKFLTSVKCTKSKKSWSPGPWSLGPLFLPTRHNMCTHDTILMSVICD